MILFSPKLDSLYQIHQSCNKQGTGHQAIYLGAVHKEPLRKSVIRHPELVKTCIPLVSTCTTVLHMIEAEKGDSLSRVLLTKGGLRLEIYPDLS
ncbi:MAG: hypothetical protein AMK71_12590 [Nitrospira bacterium SG8_35_4]|nr:MAG: hypothetical protein AMK71_12590 [Nitrospira bacterium SG8_35_4]